MDGSREFGRKQEYRSAQEVRCTKQWRESRGSGERAKGKRSDTLGNAFGREVNKAGAGVALGKTRREEVSELGVVWAEEGDRRGPLCCNILLPFSLQVAGRQHLYTPFRLQGWSMLSLAPAARAN